VSAETIGFWSALRALLYSGVEPQLVWARLWATPRRTLGLVFGAAVAAFVVSSFLPRWYKSGATLVVDTGQQMNLGGAAGMLGLAAQLGFGAGTGPTNPLFYEALLRSRALGEHVTTAKFPLGPHGELRTLEQYWSHKEHPTLRNHYGAARKLSAHLQTSANPRIQQVTFTVEGPSTRVAKLMADTVLAALNDLVVEVRRKRATAERQFLEERFQALGDSLRIREDALRRFYEQNRSLSSPQVQFEDVRLRREVDRVQSVYAQLGSQLEQARIQEVRDTPSLTVLDPPIEPVKKSAPIRRLWMLTAAILGGALALLLAMADTAGLQMQALRLQPPALRRSEQG
jgi:uncharacterized protein involved in exopolysaccharide biosynthesis